MNTYWYIWYETFEDGKNVGRSRYNQVYAYKFNATRRAKDLFDKETYVPITKSTITYKWLVSQECPWEEEEYE